MGIIRLLFSTHNRDILFILVTTYVFSYLVYKGASTVFDAGITIGDPDSQKILFSVFSGIIGVNVYITSWAYRTATERLTAVDVLVSDIFAICRGFVVLGAVDELITSFNNESEPVVAELPQVTPPLISNLGFLSTDSIHRITGFYVSFQTLKEQTKFLMSLGKNNDKKDSVGRNFDSKYRKVMCDLIYCYFVTCENARIAMHRLLSRRDNDYFYVNCMLTCFLTDIKCFLFLIDPSRKALVDPYIESRLRQRLSSDYSLLRDPEEAYTFSAYNTALLVYLEEVKCIENADHNNIVKSIIKRSLR